MFLWDSRLREPFRNWSSKFRFSRMGDSNNPSSIIGRRPQNSKILSGCRIVAVIKIAGTIMLWRERSPNILGMGSKDLKFTSEGSNSCASLKNIPARRWRDARFLINVIACQHVIAASSYDRKYAQLHTFEASSNEHITTSAAESLWILALSNSSAVPPNCTAYFAELSNRCLKHGSNAVWCDGQMCLRTRTRKARTPQMCPCSNERGLAEAGLCPSLWVRRLPLLSREIHLCFSYVHE